MALTISNATSSNIEKRGWSIQLCKSKELKYLGHVLYVVRDLAMKWLFMCYKYSVIWCIPGMIFT